MKLKIVAYYSVFIGVSVICMWIIILLSETPPEGKTELSLHLFSEFLMALLCISGGILLLRKKPFAGAVTTAGLGMVIYSVLNAAGYYGQRNELPMLVMFVILFVLTSVALSNIITRH